MKTAASDLILLQERAIRQREATLLQIFVFQLLWLGLVSALSFTSTVAWWHWLVLSAAASLAACAYNIAAAVPERVSTLVLHIAAASACGFVAVLRTLNAIRCSQNEVSACVATAGVIVDWLAALSTLVFPAVQLIALASAMAKIQAAVLVRAIVARVFSATAADVAAAAAKSTAPNVASTRFDAPAARLNSDVALFRRNVPPSSYNLRLV